MVGEDFLRGTKMITTVRADLTFEGLAGKAMASQSEKKVKRFLKEITGAVDVEIIEVNSWNEDDEEERNGKK